MTLVLLLTLALATCSHAQRQSGMPSCMAGLDIGSLINELHAGITISWKISGHWSAEGYGSTCLKHHDKSSGEELMHESEFNAIAGSDNEERNHVLNRTEIGVRYWPAGTFKGSFIGLGVMKAGENRTDLTASIGYMLDIWKGLAAVVSFETEMLQSWKEGHLRGRGLGVGICYRF